MRLTRGFAFYLVEKPFDRHLTTTAFPARPSAANLAHGRVEKIVVGALYRSQFRSGTLIVQLACDLNQVNRKSFEQNHLRSGSPEPAWLVTLKYLAISLSPFSKDTS